MTNGPLRYRTGQTVWIWRNAHPVKAIAKHFHDIYANVICVTVGNPPVEISVPEPLTAPNRSELYEKMLGPLPGRNSPQKLTKWSAEQRKK